jgi:hypothetical protein
MNISAMPMLWNAKNGALGPEGGSPTLLALLMTGAAAGFSG